MSGTAVLCKPEGDAFDELSSFVLDSAVLSQSGRLQHCARNGHVVFAPWRTGSAVAVGSKRIRSYLHQRRQEEAGIPFICLRTVDQAQIPGSCKVAMTPSRPFHRRCLFLQNCPAGLALAREQRPWKPLASAEWLVEIPRVLDRLRGTVPRCSRDDVA